jgi:H+-transporting ATPase
VAAVLGLGGLVASFTLFILGREVFDLGPDELQTLMYLKLSVAGHLTIFATRTRGPFWSSRPSGLLLGAVLGTQVIATLIAVYGVLVPGIGWGWAAVVWAFALGSLVVNDQLKLLTYHALDRRERAASDGPGAAGTRPVPSSS